MGQIQKTVFKSKDQTVPGFELTTIKDFYQPQRMRSAGRHSRVNFYVLMYVTHGEGSHEVDFQSFSLRPGDVILVNRHRVHRFLLNDTMDGYIIHFTDTFLHNKDIVHAVDILEPYLQQYDFPVIHLSDEANVMTHQLMAVMETFYKMNEDPLLPAIIHSNFRTLMLFLHQQSQLFKPDRDPSNYQRFVRFMELVEKHCKEIHSVKEYAELLHVTPKTLNQYTRKAVDMSAKQFIINRCIVEIKRCLSTGEMSIGEISDELGFSEQTNMTKFFKKHTGMAPSTFIEERC